MADTATLEEVDAFLAKSGEATKPAATRKRGPSFSRPDVAEAYGALTKALKEAGYTTQLFSADRSKDAQAALYNAATPVPGKSYRVQRNGKPVAAPGSSNHEYGVAVDLAAFKNGKRVPGREIATIAANHGWRWHGEDDDVHFNYNRSAPIASAQEVDNYLLYVKSQEPGFYERQKPRTVQAQGAQMPSSAPGQDAGEHGRYDPIYRRVVEPRGLGEKIGKELLGIPSLGQQHQMLDAVNRDYREAVRQGLTPAPPKLSQNPAQRAAELRDLQRGQDAMAAYLQPFLNRRQAALNAIEKSPLSKQIAEMQRMIPMRGLEGKALEAANAQLAALMEKKKAQIVQTFQNSLQGVSVPKALEAARSAGLSQYALDALPALLGAEITKDITNAKARETSGLLAGLSLNALLMGGGGLLSEYVLAPALAATAGTLGKALPKAVTRAASGPVGKYLGKKVLQSQPVGAFGALATPVTGQLGKETRQPGSVAAQAKRNPQGLATEVAQQAAEGYGAGVLSGVVLGAGWDSLKGVFRKARAELFGNAPQDTTPPPNFDQPHGAGNFPGAGATFEESVGGQSRQAPPPPGGGQTTTPPPGSGRTAPPPPGGAQAQPGTGARPGPTAGATAGSTPSFRPRPNGNTWAPETQQWVRDTVALYQDLRNQMHDLRAAGQNAQASRLFDQLTNAYKALNDLHRASTADFKAAKAAGQSKAWADTRRNLEVWFADSDLGSRSRTYTAAGPGQGATAGGQAKQQAQGKAQTQGTQAAQARPAASPQAPPQEAPPPHPPAEPVVAPAAPVEAVAPQLAKVEPPQPAVSAARPRPSSQPSANRPGLPKVSQPAPSTPVTPRGEAPVTPVTPKAPVAPPAPKRLPGSSSPSSGRPGLPKAERPAAVESPKVAESAEGGLTAEWRTVRDGNLWYVERRGANEKTFKRMSGASPSAEGARKYLDGLVNEEEGVKPRAPRPVSQRPATVKGSQSETPPRRAGSVIPEAEWAKHQEPNATRAERQALYDEAQVEDAAWNTRYSDGTNRKGLIDKYIADGFTEIERRGPRFYLRNPESRSTIHIGDAVGQRYAKVALKYRATPTPEAPVVLEAAPAPVGARPEPLSVEATKRIIAKSPTPDYHRFLNETIHDYAHLVHRGEKLSGAELAARVAEHYDIAEPRHRLSYSALVHSPEAMQIGGTTEGVYVRGRFKGNQNTAEIVAAPHAPVAKSSTPAPDPLDTFASTVAADARKGGLWSDSRIKSEFSRGRVLTAKDVATIRAKAAELLADEPELAAAFGAAKGRKAKAAETPRQTDEVFRQKPEILGRAPAPEAKRPAGNRNPMPSTEAELREWYTREPERLPMQNREGTVQFKNPFTETEEEDLFKAVLGRDDFDASRSVFNARIPRGPYPDDIRAKRIQIAKELRDITARYRWASDELKRRGTNPIEVLARIEDEIEWRADELKRLSAEAKKPFTAAARASLDAAEAPATTPPPAAPPTYKRGSQALIGGNVVTVKEWKPKSDTVTFQTNWNGEKTTISKQKFLSIAKPVPEGKPQRPIITTHLGAFGGVDIDKRAATYVGGSSATHLRSLGDAGARIAKDLDDLEVAARRESSHDIRDLKDLWEPEGDKKWTPLEVQALALYGDKDAGAAGNGRLKRRFRDDRNGEARAKDFAKQYAPVTETVTINKIGNLWVVDITPLKKIRDADAPARALMDRGMNEASRLGIKRRVGDQKITLKGGGSWVPHILNDLGRKLLEEARKTTPGSTLSPRLQDAVDEMVQKGKARDEQDALDKIKNFADQQRRQSIPYYERERLAELPNEYYEWDLNRILPDLLRRGWMTIEGARRWGPEFEKLDALLTRVGDESSGAEARKVDSFLRYTVGNVSSHGPSPGIRKIVGTVSAAMTAVKMGGIPLGPVTIPTLGTLQNYFQRFTNTTDAGLLPKLQAQAELWTPWRDASRKLYKQMERAGAMAGETALEDYDALMHRHVAAMMRSFSGVERNNHYVAARVAQLQLEADMRLLAAMPGQSPLQQVLRNLMTLGGSSEGAATRRMERLGVGKERLLKALAGTDPLTQDEIEEAMIRAVNDNQFAQTLANMPQWWQQKPWARLLVKFKPYQFKQTMLIWNNVAKEAKAGNVLPLARFVLWTTLAGAIYSGAAAALYGRRDDIKALPARMWDWFAQGGGVGLLNSFAYGDNDMDRILRFTGGPIYGSTKNAIETKRRIQRNPKVTDLALKEWLKNEVTLYRQFDTTFKGISSGSRDISRDLQDAKANARSFENQEMPEKESDYSEGPNALVYRAASQALARGHESEALELLRSKLKPVKVSDVKNALKKRGPQGYLTNGQWQKFLQALPPERAMQFDTLNQEWNSRVIQMLAGEDLPQVTADEQEP